MQNHMIKIAHECPKSIFDEVEEQTDYSYALVHLFEEDAEYYDQFVAARIQGREIILDNSVFELETAFDAERFVHWVERLNPTYYIIPDVLEDCDQTIRNVQDWFAKYSYLTNKSIGVVQGKTYEEVVKCYKAVEPMVDKVAISFDYSFFRDWFPNELTKYHSWVKGRQRLLYLLVADGVINTSKPHHLLGCGLPQEFDAYKQYTWIDSLDTSNPVVAGIKGIRYNGAMGLQDKPSQKLYTLINDELTGDQKVDVFYNIEQFRKIVND